MLTVSTWELPITEAVKNMVIQEEAARRRGAKDARLVAPATSRRGQAAAPATKKRAASGAHRGESEEDSGESEEDPSEFVPDADAIKKFREKVLLSVQSEAITGLGVQKLNKLRKEVANSEEFKKQKQFGALLDVAFVLAEDNRKSHQHTSMLLVSEICL
jgi:hypothetical protein